MTHTHCITKDESRVELQLSEERTNARIDKLAMDNSRMVSNLFGDLQKRMDILGDKMDASILDRNSIHGLLELNRQSHITLQSTTDETLKQAKATNGRVSSLENWKWFITGGLAIITAILLPIAMMVVHAWITNEL